MIYCAARSIEDFLPLVYSHGPGSLSSAHRRGSSLLPTEIRLNGAGHCPDLRAVGSVAVIPFCYEARTSPSGLCFLLTRFHDRRDSDCMFNYGESSWRSTVEARLVENLQSWPSNWGTAATAFAPAWLNSAPGLPTQNRRACQIIRRRFLRAPW